MGYTTDFSGAFQLDKPLTEQHKNYLLKFAETRRMKRDETHESLSDDPLRVACGLPVGVQGEYYVNEGGFAGQNRGSSVIDGNRPPESQPSLWCQWIPNDDGTAIIWDGGEKFYEYQAWIEYIVKHFLKIWGYTLNGSVTFQGEDLEDRGTLIMTDNILSSQEAESVIETLDDLCRKYKRDSDYDAESFASDVMKQMNY